MEFDDGEAETKRAASRRKQTQDELIASADSKLAAYEEFCADKDDLSVEAPAKRGALARALAAAAEAAERDAVRKEDYYDGRKLWALCNAYGGGGGAEQVVRKLGLYSLTQLRFVYLTFDKLDEEQRRRFARCFADPAGARPLLDRMPARTKSSRLKPLPAAEVEALMKNGEGLRGAIRRSAPGVGRPRLSHFDLFPELAAALGEKDWLEVERQMLLLTDRCEKLHRQQIELNGVIALARRYLGEDAGAGSASIRALEDSLASVERELLAMVSVPDSVRELIDADEAPATLAEAIADFGDRHLELSKEAVNEIPAAKRRAVQSLRSS